MIGCLQKGFSIKETLTSPSEGAPLPLLKVLEKQPPCRDVAFEFFIGHYSDCVYLCLQIMKTSPSKVEKSQPTVANMAYVDLFLLNALFECECFIL